MHKYFRIGDVVMNKEIWGSKLFVIHGLGGNNYFPELYVHPVGEKPNCNNSCNWGVRDTKLIFSNKRPLKNISLKILKKLIKKNNCEAKREFIFRNRKK